MDKIFFNYHCHTKRCGHAVGEDEEYVRQAINHGIKVFGISDHRPIKGLNMPNNNMDYKEFDNYLATFSDIKNRYSDIVDILIGLEAEYYLDNEDEIKEYYKKCDYLILGQHTKSKGFKESFNHYCDNDLANEYCRLVCTGIETGLFSYVAHPDYYFAGTDDINEVFIKTANIICQKASETNTPLEINLKGASLGKKSYRQGMFFSYPNRLFWEIASKYSIKCVYGVDAHDPNFFSRIDEVRKDVDKELSGINLDIIDYPFIKRKGGITS